LAVTRGGTGEQRADRLNGQSIAANDSTDIGLAQLHSEDRHFPGRNFREHHLVRKFHELANDEFEEFFHVSGCSSGAGAAGVSVADSTTGSLGAIGSVVWPNDCFLFFLINL